MKLKKLIAVAAAFVTIAATSITAMAGTAVGTGSETSDKAHLSITKELLVGEGVTYPDVTFSYTFTQQVADADEAAGYMKKPADVTAAGIAYTGATNGLDTSLTQASTITLPTYTAAGVYKYVITETSNNQSNIAADTSKYTMYVTVKNTSSGVVVDSVVVVKGDGSTNTEAKVSATTPTGTTDPNPPAGSTDGADINTNGFKFTSSFTETTTGIDANGDGDYADDGDVAGKAFILTSAVSGELADKTREFSYKITVSLPITAADTAPTGSEGTFAKDATTPVARQYIAEITLHDGESFSFAALPTGTKVKVEQTGAPKYTAGYSGASNASPVSSSAVAGANLSTSELLVGKYGARVDYTNTFDDSVTPTGVNVSTVPFMVMMAAALAFAGVVVFSRRREEE